MSGVKRFAIPTEKLARGWDRATDYARLVEARHLSEKEYYEAHREVGSVYFIADAMAGDPIKIGWSRDPARRLQQLQIGNPASLKLIGCVAATRMIEPALHQLFALNSVSGEWFTDPEGSIRTWLNEMTFGDPIARCRWYKAGADYVNWRWDETTNIHRPIFARRTE